MSYEYLNLIRPFVSILPDVKSPGRQIYFQEKLVWTLVALLIYLVSSQVPLYGIMSSDKADPLYWMRIMTASNRGTLMDLGISPVLSSSMITQFLTSSGFLKVNWSIKEDRILFNALGKLIALLLTLGQAVGQVFTGFYGSPKSLGAPICCLLVLQLMFSGIIIILLDEMLSKGYGMGSGVNLFIVANICESVFWKALSPKVFNTARGVEFEGALVALVHLLMVRKNKFHAIYEAFFRQNLPNLYSLTTTFILFAIVIYFHGVRMEIPLQSTSVKGQTGKWPIKLFYSNTTPIIVQSQIISHVGTVSRFFYDRYPNNELVKFLGVWDINKYKRLTPISGLCYFIHQPDNFYTALSNPIQFIIYLTVMIGSAAFISKAWIDVNEKSPQSVAKQIKNQKMTIVGVKEENIEKRLEKIIPTAAFLGGIVISAICVFSSVLDTVGSGTNMILAVGIIWPYFEALTKETMKSGGMVMGS